ncbi:coronin-2B-like [Sycon ciliatum]|uniref:coronin-2B-like n=1 Tax=Sycon ciliatum TaxID=27933 RepID=UPI0020ACE65E|eukprot:scpid65003/ scgid8549/ Coronin-2B; Coronin-like protein C; Protein FC96
MSKSVVRTSKFRHVFGSASKQCFDGLRVTKNANDSQFCVVNTKFLAVVCEAGGGGAFNVIPLEQTGRTDVNAPRVTGHKGPVMDVAWNPFNENMIASCADDCMVKCWIIPDGGLTDNLTESAVDLMGHQRRVGSVLWHPTANNILASAGFDYLIILWNVGTGEAVTRIECHTDTIYSISFNFDGSQMATSSKDKKIRIINPRDGAIIKEGQGHAGSKACRVIFTSADRLFTTGFSKMSERQYAIWDTSDISKALKMEMIDTASGVLFPFFDFNTNMVYLAGKGDGNVRYYELVEDRPYCFYLDEYKSSAPQRGLGILPKRAVDVPHCEVMRLYKLHQKGLIEPICFKVPRKSELFQEDLFPPCLSDEPSLTAEEWLSGKNAEPKLINLKDGFVPSSRPTFVAPEKKVVEEEAVPKGERELLKAYHTLKAEIKALEEKLATANIKIRTLEQK